MKPVCFMVMPFRRKAVTNAKDGAPKEVDFDRLWDAALMPAIQRLGYAPIRADAEAGSVIVKDMLNRLKHSDLVVADVSIPNGNVYYEVGIRHVAREKRCVLLAADWFQPLFDINAFRILTYPLADGNVPADQAAAIEKHLVASLPAFVDTATPYHTLVDAEVQKAFAEEAERLSRFQVELGTVRQMRKGDARSAKIEELVREHSHAARLVPEVALELVSLIRDMSDWKSVCAFIETLPSSTRATATVREQHYLALSKLGRHAEAIAGLEDLIASSGPSPERCGLLGGRYKVRYDEAVATRKSKSGSMPSHDEARNLTKAIEAYERGFLLDLNEYYCSSNLPALLRERGGNGDRERADAIETLVIVACRRAEERKSQDPWLLDSLFGALFRRGDVASVDEIADRIVSGVPWRLDATLKDADRWLAQAPLEKREPLSRIVERLRAFRTSMD
ncbi:MAG: TRAFs-binding domain-containing protein [Planctomycetota bacterium]